MSKPAWQKERRENFQKIIAATPQDVDYVADGWTELTRRLKPVLSSKELAARLGRKPTSEEREFAAEIADYRVMNGIRSRVEDDRGKDRATAEVSSLVPMDVQASVLPRRLSRGVQPVPTSNSWMPASERRVRR